MVRAGLARATSAIGHRPRRTTGRAASQTIKLFISGSRVVIDVSAAYFMGELAPLLGQISRFSGQYPDGVSSGLPAALCGLMHGTALLCRS